jgi:Holliday junction resolvase-like predicted endonuclease
MPEIAIFDLMKILRESKEDNCLNEVESRLDDVLRAVGARKLESGTWEIEKSLRIDLALRAVSTGAEIERVVNLLTWKDFEGLVANILTQNDYRCVESFRRRGTSETKGMEIDVIGHKGNSIIAVDAKMWGSRTGKSSALKTAAEKQKERTKRLCEMMPRLSEKIGGVANGQYTLTPLLVTWMVEEVIIHDGVPIVPVFNLNSFLQDIAVYEDMIATSTCVYEG